MKTLTFERLYWKGRWFSPATVTLSDQGVVEKVEESIRGKADYGIAIPALVNSHSHAFQYAMAGLSEHIASESKNDNFWAWRESMYRLALKLNPEQMKVIARHLYSEMLSHGYSSVAEFHYLHKDEKGNSYRQPIEMSLALAEAAKEAGIRLCLIPVYYRLGDFGQPANDRQRRFLFSGVDEYFSFVEEVGKHCPVGLGVHSLRVAEKEEITKIFEVHLGRPHHIHISEQQKEVQGCVEHHGARPVEWLLENVNIDSNSYLVHATHLEEKEREGLSKRGNVVLCPSTEANLGDGLFPLEGFQGRWCIGTDSHVGLSPFEELRWVEYGQRLITQRRNVFCQANHWTGNRLFDEALRTGQGAVGNSTEYFDAIVFESSHPLIAGVPDESRLSTVLFSCDRSAIKGTLIGGEPIRQEESFGQEFLRVMREIWN